MNREDLLEKLADSEHERWSRWMRWMFTDTNYTEENVARWKKQMRTPYSELSEGEKDSDRKEARRTIEIFQEYIRGL